jgi:RimJ/RimL family protein N-acetyltransferase
MELRPLTLDDLSFYRRVYTDPRMWAELGGVPEEDMAAKIERDVRAIEDDSHWVLVIVTEEGEAAGTVSLWDHEWDSETIDEIGWMILPEFQRRGLASAAVAEALGRADAAGRWQVLHAFPGTANAPSNALCCKNDFALLGPLEYTYRGRTLRVNHWVRDRLPQ